MKRSFLFALIFVFGLILISIISSSFVIPTGAAEIKTDLPQGWSMISLPLTPDSAALSHIFHDAEVVYRYEKGSGYICVKESEILEVGKGYWILLNEAKSYTLTGEPICENLYAEYEDGWYLIGGCTYPTRISIEEGDVIVIYRYAQGVGYQRVPKSEKIKPGKGYWILLKDIEEGTILRCYCYSGHGIIQDPNKCQECHLGNPVFGETDYRDLKFKDDIVNLCYRCHSKESLGESHPVNIVPPNNMDIPEDLPLDENMNITCATCHQHHTELTDFPSYLRRTNIENALCLACHDKKMNGPHKLLGQNECGVCHIPHHAADDMLWARATTGPFTGVKRLCFSCHGIGYLGAQDRYNIFNEYDQAITYDHAMGPDASIDGSSIIREDWSLFPLKEKEGGDGFYCGSCHDPHLNPYYDPTDDQGGGDYLRQETAELIKNAKDKENSFCKQCHKDIIFGDASGHGNKKGCYDCHHPHSSNNPGPKIFISPLVSFTAIPNCQGFSDSGETVSACYGCHMEGSGFDGALGAPLAGDNLYAPREHHPMGIGADASTSGHQPTQAGPLSPSGELYCESCHSVHDGTNDHYLNPQIVSRFDPANSALFCIACHSNKTIEDLGPRGEGHNQISPNNQCLFCHSIHNAPNDPYAEYQTDEDEATQDNSSVSVDVIMRIAPENLAWSDKIIDTDTRDYEDACYGCHFRPEIVGAEFSPNEDNSLLQDNVRDNYFSHRFNVIPSASIKLTNTFDDLLPIVSDGQETETINDYGIEEGRIWCGSCHNVHRQNRFLPEIHEDYKERRSAYLREENYGSSLCHRCHTSYHEDLGGMNHPQDIPLEGGVPSLYYEGYSAGIGGLTNGDTMFDTSQGEVVCQTCHSVHTAKTDWDGSNEDNLLEQGKLLVKAIDDGFCQDCHSEGHGGASGDCATCHSSHNGILLFIDQNIINAPFIALPNVPSINDPEYPNLNSSSSCYGCHQPHHLLGDDNLLRLGAAPIYGDLLLEEYNTVKKINHHPMGTQAKLTGSTFLRAPGAEATKNLNKNGEITCVSCHANLHGVIDGKDYSQSKENNFLRWDFTNDNAEFCIKCHSDKVMGSNKIEYDKKHFWNTTDSPITRKVFNPNAPGQDYERQVSCRQCMFCHFIHDGEERDNEVVSGSIRADIDALMRIDPENLAWGDRADDTDLNDYEDMCYGCHSNESIVGGGCDSGALLKWSDDNHTHRFACTPDPNSPPSTVIKYGGVFPLSDGKGTVTKNDYGIQQESIFCGTCHNVHDSRVSPYLNHEPGDINLSPYEPYSFCEECHDAESSQFKFVHGTHPINKGPNPELGSKPTYAKWPDLYHSGESGCQGGVTQDGSDSGKIICLTCHNIHAAATNWKGEISTDTNSSTHGKLLIRDNLSTEGGSDLCRDCHLGSNGPHFDERIRSPKGSCATCHITHKAKGPKLWARTSTKPGLYDGIHQLCQTCHDGTMFFDGSASEGGGEKHNTTGFETGDYPPIKDYKGEFIVEIRDDGEMDVYASTGTDDVLDESSSVGPYESHVMHGGADLNLDEALIDFDSSVFPLDETDKDNFPQAPAPEKYRSGGAGFYCGTCHNPHKQPDGSDASGGFYLRTKPGHSVGSPWDNRKPFCSQCHGVYHFPEFDCLACHHPHLGKTLIRDDEFFGRKIFRYPVEEKEFSAMPNVPGITDDQNNDQYTSRFCYACHNAEAGQTFGIPVIFGDDALDMKKEHHPMGTQASLLDPNKVRGGIFIRAPGTPLQLLNKNGQLTCTSCHDDDHGLGPFTNISEGKANAFLRWVLNDSDEKDRVDFCIACHTAKSENNLYGKHLIYADDSPNGRGGCMFCHFIHDGEERQNTDDIGMPGVLIRPDVDSLMRVYASNLSWGDNTGDTDIYDYEDLCFGCHGIQNIVGGPGVNGSLLEPDEHFTHPFALPADLGLIGEGFPVSDGSDPNILDDYGTQSGHIYCGTCHDVHNNQTSPYLGNHPTPYQYKDPNKEDGFCEACHNKDGQFVSSSHPIGVGPNPDSAQGSPTAPEFVDTYNGGGALFSEGGSGEPGGITSPYDPKKGESTSGGSGKIICLTCHNVHAAVTSWEGKTKTDSNQDHGFLLVKDNMKERVHTSPGSELCKACHPFGESEYSFPEGVHGDGTLSGGQGICKACHTPHGSSGPKLWSIECPSSQDPDRGCFEIGPFQGFRQLCFSCHNVNYVLTGSKTVFKDLNLGDQIPPEGYYPEDHVMRHWADIDGVEGFDTSHFPLDSNDRDTIPTADKPDPNSHNGFYCGSCHNPHLQPDLGGGYYLRSKDGNAGSLGSRKDFCDQCHKYVHEGTSYENIECLECHHPHNGSTRIDEDPDVGRLIFITGYTSLVF